MTKVALTLGSCVTSCEGPSGKGWYWATCVGARMSGWAGGLAIPVMLCIAAMEAELLTLDTG